MKNFKNALPAVAATIASAVLLASPSFAFEPASSKVSTTIDQRDLQTNDGIERVWFQLSRKEKQSCDTSSVTTLSEARAEAVCTNSLLNSFIDDVDHTALTAFHLAHRDQ